jgi:hypothetical protein
MQRWMLSLDGGAHCGPIIAAVPHERSRDWVKNLRSEMAGTGGMTTFGERWDRVTAVEIGFQIN